MTPEGPPVSRESVDALARCLMPHPAALGSRTAGFRSWLERCAERWVRAGITGPEQPRPEGQPGPPEPAEVDPDSINLVRATHLEDVREAAEWAAGARFLSTERRVAMTLLTDVLAIGAAEPLPAFLAGGEAESILGSFGGRSVPSVTLWRPVAGRTSAELWSAIVWNRLVGDPQELHAGPECIAAAVAAAEAGDRTLGELLDAIVVGCGIGSWHRDAVGGAMEEAGVHTPGALAPVAAAAAVGRLEGIGARNLAQSIRRASALTPLHPYRAFSDGTRAKLLFGAFGQLLGAATALSIKNPIGLLPAPSLSRRSRHPGLAPFDPRTATRAIHTIPLKKFSGSRAVQSVLAAMEKLPRVDPETVESITVETYPFSATVSGWSRPDTGPIAMQSHIPTAVALWLEARHRRVPFSADHYPRFRAPGTITLADRVTVEPHEFGEAGAPPSRRIRWAKVTIRSRTGPDLTASSGPPFAPPPPGAIRDRFANLTRGAAVRDPHQFPYSAPVRGFLGLEPATAPREPPPTVLPAVGPAGSGEAASKPDSGADSLFGRS
ncbi:MAG: MmgE/PrpD family protein [Acidobacteriota bacterium]|nr:MmgE/PrpD family protein [Acidobacteriota bacterium]